MAIEVGSAFISIVPSFSGFASALAAGVGLEGEKIGRKLGTDMATGLKSTSGVIAMASVAVGVAGAAVFASAVKSAGDFQASMVKLTTTAGETGTMTTGNLKKVSDGILQLSGQTATSQKQLSDGMYMVESAGFHGADGLKVLQAAAEGARSEQAQLPTVTNAVTSALTSFHLKATDSVSITNEMVAAVGHGKMTFDDFAGSLSTVLPVASAAGLSFAEVAGAEATLTNHGTSAHEATQELANTIRNLQAPNRVAVGEMDRLGLSSNDLAQNLGKRGLTGTLDIVSKAITDHMGPDGLVLINTLKQSQTAAADAKLMLDAMPSSVRNVADQFLQGKVSINQFQAGIKGLPADQAAMARQFADLTMKSQGFNDLLKKGGPAAQTYTDALKKIMGGATGMNTALMLTGENMPSFEANVKAVGDAAGGAGSHVEGWSKTQGTFNFQMASFKEHLEAAKTSIGLGLIPMLATFMGSLDKVVGPIMNWVAANHQLSAIILGVVTGLAALAAVVSIVSAVVETLKLVEIATKMWAAAQWLLNIAMDANPIVLIGIAIAALVAGIVLAYQHSATFRAIVQDAMHAVGAAGMWLWNVALKPAWDALLGAWHAIVSAFQWAWGMLKPVFDFIGRHWIAFVALFLPGIGPIIAVVALLIKHWDTVKAAALALGNGVTAAFRAIGDAAIWVWANVLQPTWAAIVAAFTVVVGAFTAVWNAVGAPLFNAIGAIVGWVFNTIFVIALNVIRVEWNGFMIALQMAWDAVGKPVVDAIAAAANWLANEAKLIWLGMQIEWHNFLSGLSILWTSFGKPVWDAVLAAGRWLANEAKLIWLGMQIEWHFFLNVLSSLWNSYGKPVWDAVVAGANWVWNQLKAAFESIKQAWRTLVNDVKWVWDNVFKPVFDALPGLVRQAGDIAGRAFDGLKNAFATAFRNAKDAVANGWDVIARWVSDHVIHPINVTFGLKPGIKDVPTFRTGGPVRGPGTSTSDSIPAMLSDGEFVLSAAAVKAIGVDTLNQLNAAGRIAYTAGDASGLKFTLPGFAGGGSVDVDAIKAWIHQQAGKPYVMDANGPDAWDCSGLVGAVYALVTGQNPNRRYFSTVEEARFFQAGLGGPNDFNVGYYGGGGADGHTVGTFAGLNFEATPPVALVGHTRNTPTSGIFTGHGHMPLGQQTIWGWLYEHTVGEVRAALASAMASIAEHIPAGLGIMGDTFKAIVTSAVDLIPFDNGGLLMPGSVGVNLGRSPEPVFNAEQWSVVHDAATGGSKSETHINVYPQRADFTVRDLEALQVRQDALARVRRPR